MATDNATTRLLILGLDGATFDLIDPWIQNGDLPNLKALIERGSRAELRSTTPPMTFPAWSTMMTGLNPGGHGIFDFTQRMEGKYGVEFINASHRGAPTLWKLLSQAGLRVGVMGLPTTYPPEPVNGFMIAGFDSPVTTGIDDSFVYPPGLYQQIKENAAEYRINDFQEVNIGPGWHRLALAGMESTIQDRLKIAKYLLESQHPDCMAVLFGESDTVGHHFWSFFDPDSPRHLKVANKELAGAIRRIYILLDEALGDLVAALPDANFIVLSDHGFGGSGDQILFLNRWLDSQGYLSFAEKVSAKEKAFRWAKELGLRLTPRRLQEQLFRQGSGRLAGRVESQSRFGGIDWETTQAYSEETNSLPAIWINLHGREPNGQVKPGDYEKIREEIVEALHRWRNPLTKKAIIRRAWKREELYSGAYIDRAPDIILELALDEGYSYTCLSSQGHPGPAMIRLSQSDYLGSKGKSMNGSHRPNGILILAGPDITPGTEIQDPNLADIAPTILALLGIPNPVRMDGRVLKEALRLDLDPVAGQAPNGSRPDRPSSYNYSEEEQAILENRLRNLGYLE